MTCVVDGDQTLVGIITDGDLRRHMERGVQFLEFTAADVMSQHPVSVPPDTLAAEALALMEQRKITSVVVANGDAAHRQVAGVLHLHDLWDPGPVNAEP
jgi:arabinose-5-phosphate isomerase